MPHWQGKVDVRYREGGRRATEVPAGDSILLLSPLVPSGLKWDRGCKEKARSQTQEAQTWPGIGGSVCASPELGQPGAEVPGTAAAPGSWDSKARAGEGEGRNQEEGAFCLCDVTIGPGESAFPLRSRLSSLERGGQEADECVVRRKGEEEEKEENTEIMNE
ncbi:hypothetical protein LX36DRAFT_351896 [Colletotrichum falcatum]|nr:hypothetical protein LX36DRAFT_351896 [Colletotrichum falcatum]